MPQSERKYHIHVSKKILYLSYVKKKKSYNSTMRGQYNWKKEKKKYLTILQRKHSKWSINVWGKKNTTAPQ